MLDEMTIDDTNIDFSYLAEFENVDFVICMNPRLSNTEKLNSMKCTLKGKKFFPKSFFNFKCVKICTLHFLNYYAKDICL